MEEANSKQQVTEVLRAAETVVIATSSRPDSDQIASTIALAQMMDKLGKRTEAVYSGDVPSSLSFLPTDKLHKQFNGIRDFVVEIDTSRTEADRLKYVPGEKHLKIYITPVDGNFNKEDLSHSYGEYHCDVLVMIGTQDPAELDKALASQKALLDKTRLISIMAGSQVASQGAGSVAGAPNQPAPTGTLSPKQPAEAALPKQINWHEPLASSISEMLMSLTEALQAGLLDNHIATSLLTGIVGATDHFTSATTTPKVMTMAAQLMAAGADQGSIIKHLEKSPSGSSSHNSAPRPEHAKASRHDHELKPSQEKELSHHHSSKKSPKVNKPRDHTQEPANPNPPPKFPGGSEPAHITDQPIRSIPPQPPTTQASTTFPPPPPPLAPAKDPADSREREHHSPPPPDHTVKTPESEPPKPPTLDVESARRAVEEATRDLPSQ